jgi:hypothetical protein
MASARTHGGQGPQQFSDSCFPPVAVTERHVVGIVPDRFDVFGTRHAANVLVRGAHALFCIAHRAIPQLGSSDHVSLSIFIKKIRRPGATSVRAAATASAWSTI